MTMCCLSASDVEFKAGEIAKMVNSLKTADLDSIGLYSPSQPAEVILL